MEGFLQNNELTYERNSYYAKNTFLHAKVDMSKPVTYDEVRDKLPQPIFDGHDSYLACYDYAWQVAFSNLSRPVEGSGFVSPFIDTAFNGCLFMWDSTFIMMFTRYAEHLWPFQKTLDNFYALQHRDGFICREIIEANGQDRFTRHDPAATGPNIMAWSELEYYENFGDIDRLRRAYAPLRAYHIWLRRNHTWRDGSYYSSGWGCGMDNISRLEPGYAIDMSHGHMIWNDTCFQQMFNCMVLIRMNGILGNEDDVSDLREEYDHLWKLVNDKLWNDTEKYYFDLWRGDRQNGVKHIGAYWALLAKAVPPERLDDFVAHLKNEKEYARPTPVPTIPADSAEYVAEGGYWRGGVWAPTNYMVLCGLAQNGYDELAYDIAQKYLQTVVKVYEETGTLWENYAPEMQMQGSPSKERFVGWTGIAPISVLFEFVLGIRAQVSAGEITWDARRTERHGILRYPFGKDTLVDLICESRNSETEEPRVTVRSDKPVRVRIRWKGGEKILG